MIAAPWALFGIAAVFGPQGAAVGLLVLGFVLVGIYSFRPPARTEIPMPSPAELAAGEPLPLELGSGDPVEAAAAATAVEPVEAVDSAARPAPLAEALGISAPSGSEADRHLGEAIRTAAADLPEAQRVSLVGYYLEARSVQELSALLDCSESEVIGHIDTALEAIKPATDADAQLPA